MSWIPIIDKLGIDFNRIPTLKIPVSFKVISLFCKNAIVPSFSSLHITVEFSSNHKYYHRCARILKITIIIPNKKKMRQDKNGKYENISASLFQKGDDNDDEKPNT